ncbi:DNA polymerase V [Pantoea anthophila]|uniref:DNA polymerase V n=1 Tax=Pantoea anthophila TaxID=470931 RepID=UPI002DBF255C|nr:DNA polymerase V [Pantoea anthophila]MEB5707354.1 DNA polymerase V [Pantoea anthophila]MEB6518225.1 DNA polymerase V [Pantoea anthophila]
MPREYEIQHAFMKAIRRDPALGVIVTRREFVRQLELVNWHFSLKEANQWIRSNTVTFRDESTQEGEAKTYRQFNPNGGL